MLNENALAKTLAAVTGAWYVICAALFYLLPGTGLSAGRILFHGVRIESTPFDAITLFMGLILWIILAWITGMVFAKLYNQWEA